MGLATRTTRAGSGSEPMTPLAQGQALGPRFHVAFAGVMVTSCQNRAPFLANTKAIAFRYRIDLRFQLRRYALTESKSLGNTGSLSSLCPAFA